MERYFGVDSNGKIVCNFGYESISINELKQDEQKVVKAILDILDNDCMIGIQRRTKDYITMIYKQRENDFIRFKYTERAKWISIYITKEMREAYLDSQLFKAQKKKNVSFWKANIESLIDIENLREPIKSAYEFMKTRLLIDK